MRGAPPCAKGVEGGLPKVIDSKHRGEAHAAARLWLEKLPQRLETYPILRGWSISLPPPYHVPPPTSLPIMYLLGVPPRTIGVEGGPYGRLSTTYTGGGWAWMGEEEDAHQRRRRGGRPRDRLPTAYML